MLTQTFQHLPGIGATSERRLWEAGLTCWQDLDTQTEIRLTPKQRETLGTYIPESLDKLSGLSPRYFEERLPSGEHWRLFREFRETCAYVDIETTGLDLDRPEITTIALYDGSLIRYYVQGRNLDDFIRDIKTYKLIITYNGKTFDQPCIENYFGTRLPHAHIDLRYVLKSLGYGGGLKRCEKAMGIDRGGLDGVDGAFAVHLWRDFQKTRSEKTLHTLLAYNIEDVVNLEILMVKAYNLKLRQTPFFPALELPMPLAPDLPFAPDMATVERIRKTSAFFPFSTPY